MVTPGNLPGHATLLVRTDPRGAWGTYDLRSLLAGSGRDGDRPRSASWKASLAHDFVWFVDNQGVRFLGTGTVLKGELELEDLFVPQRIDNPHTINILDSTNPTRIW